jgi:uncharacterized repeat protein (TIGR01451 family)
MKGKVAFIVILLALATVQAIGQALWNGNGHYYQVVGDPGVDWATANALAEAATFEGLGGHLATITSAGENSFVTALLPSGGNEYWLGGYQVPPTQPIATAGWTWVNGEGTFPGVNGAFGYANPYSNWNAGEPNDNFGVASEQFMAIWASNGGGNVRGTWNDDGNLGDLTGYVVEYQKSVTLVTGTVSYICDGSPIAGAIVDIGGNLATTDGNGHYSITNVAAGVWTATVSQSNYYTYTCTLSVPAAAKGMTWSCELYSWLDILSQPHNVSVPAGSNATFTVGTACSTSDGYQWQFNGINLADNGRIAGSLSNSLSISNVREGDAGGYSVVVHDPLGAVTSSVATLTVLLPTPSVTWTNPAPITYGTALSSSQLNASASSPGTFAYTPANGSVLYAGTNALSVIFTPTGTGDYQSVTDTVSLLVLPASLSVTAGDATRPYGEPNPVFTGMVAGIRNGDNISATYSCSAVSNSLPGPYPIVPTVAFNPSGMQTNYHVSLTNGTLTVFRATPSVTWTNPAPITYGTALNSKQLSASANSPGTFAYTPANGSVLYTGTNALSVIFSPTGTAGYTSVTDTVSLLVLPAPLTITASSATRPYGQTNPVFTGTITGIQNGDNISATYSCSAISNSLPDPYPIVPTVVFSPSGMHTNYQVSLTNGTLTVLPVPSGPNVWITEPTNGASFAAGAAIELAAAASDAQGTVTQVEFFQGGTNLLGIAANAPYSVLWTNVLSGGYWLTARATDNYGLGSTSAVVNIVVTNAPTQELAVSILTPANYASFCLGQSVVISAAVTGATTPVQVEYLTGDGTSLGTASSDPYNLTWLPTQLGTYSLTARAKDKSGTALSTNQVQLIISSQCGEVAIVRVADDPEIEELQNDLFLDLKLGSYVLGQELLSAGALNTFILAIWDGLGTSTNGPTPGAVDALYAAYTNGIPVYLIGERLASGATLLHEPERSWWTSLTRLSAPSGTDGNGTIVVQSSLGYNPILDGFFGTVTNFPYPAQLDLATNTDANTEVLGTSGGADVLLAYPGFQVVDTNRTRLFAQEVRVSPPDVPQSKGVLRSLFENTVYWLLGEGWCTDVALYPQSSATPDPAQVGQPLEYHLGLTRGGECEATGVMVTNALPAGVQFVSAQTDQGSWSYDPVARQVTFLLGYLGVAAQAQMTITVMPVAAGMITNLAAVRANGAVVNPGQSTLAEVTDVNPGPDLTPTLHIRFISANVYDLSLDGAANVAYDLQSSPDLKTWTTVAIVLGPHWEKVFTLGNSGSPAGGFYRAGLAQ